MDNRLPDTPWHVGYVKKEESDPRRHKARCIHNKGVCTYGKLKCYMKPCPGSAHCIYYAENLEQEKEIYLKTRTAEEEEADTFRRAIRKIKSMNIIEEKSETETQNSKKPHKFTGVEYVRINKIRLHKDYYSWKPNDQEFQKVIQFYEAYKKMDKPIVIELIDEKYYLKDNYMQYYASKKLNKTWIKCVMDIDNYNKRKKK